MIVTIDIETMANKSWHWKFWQEKIGINQMIEPTYMRRTKSRANGLELNKILSLFECLSGDIKK